MSTELWAWVPGYESVYEVSSLGRVRRAGRVLKTFPRNQYGHLAVNLCRAGKMKLEAVHRLVLLAFVGPCPEGKEACHSDGVATNNRLENLRWDTHRANNQDRLKHGTYSRGRAHPQSKITEVEVRRIRELYADGLGQVPLAKIFGLCHANIHYIVTRKTWAHI